MSNHLDFSIIQLTTIREAILSVLDSEIWCFDASDMISEDMANEDRLKFCDAVQTYLVKEAQKANAEVIDVKARAF